MLTFERTIQPPRGTKWEVVYKNGGKRDRVQLCFVAVDDALYFRDGFKKPFFFAKITGWRQVSWFTLGTEICKRYIPGGHTYFDPDIYDALREVYRHYGLPDNAFVEKILKPL